MPTAVRVCAPTSEPKTSSKRSEHPFITLVVCVKPGATSTMPERSNQAMMRSRSASERLRLPSVESVASRARRVGLLGRDLDPDTPERGRQRPVTVQQDVPGNICTIPMKPNS